MQQPRRPVRFSLRLLAAALLLAGGVTRPSPAQRPMASPVVPGSDITIHLVTIGPGKLAWERFGHNGIWVRDPERGIDAVYNYGLFSFRQESFIWRFIQGRMLYWMQGLPAGTHLESYVAANRSVWLQELNLTPRQRIELRDFLLWNERPENRFYRYDYYRDNCSTRVRDAIDRVIGNRIQARTAALPGATTFRWHTRRLTTIDLPLYTGLLIGLGEPVDRPISPWEEMFLPIKVREHIRDVTIPDAQGREVPLVKAERTLFTGTEPDPPATPPNWVGWYALAGIGLAGTFLALHRGTRRSRVARVALAGSTGLWLLLVGMLGMVLAGLWLFTDHAFSYHNENLLLFNPIALPLAALAPAAILGAGRVKRWAGWLGMGTAGLAILGLVLHVLPGFGQVNGELIALVLPVQLVVGWLAVGSHSRAVPD